MRLAFLAALVLALALPALPQGRRSHATAAAQAPSEEDQKAIADLQNRDILANMAVDTDKIMALRTDDVVYLVPGRAPLVGQAAVRNYLEEIRKQLTDWDMVAYEENWQEVRIIGEYGYQWGAINIRAKRAGETAESAATRNVMRVLQRQADGSWKIARVIFNIQSVPKTPESSVKERPRQEQ